MSAFGSEASAELYNLQYPQKDYPGEAAWLHGIATRYSTSEQELTSFFDAGCGAGDHLATFGQLVSADGQPTYSRLAGVDTSQPLLALAKTRVPGAELRHDDMAEVDLGFGKYEVVASLFTAISYLGDLTKIRAGIGNLAKHVAPGGVFIAEPWLSPREFPPELNDTLRQLELRPDKDTELIRRAVMRGPEPGQEGVVTMDMGFLFSRRCKETGKLVIDAFNEQHEIGLYERETYIQAIEDAGLTFVDVETPPPHLQIMRPILIGRRER